MASFPLSSTAIPSGSASPLLVNAARTVNRALTPIERSLTATVADQVQAAPNDALAFPAVGLDVSGAVGAMASTPEGLMRVAPRMGMDPSADVGTAFDAAAAAASASAGSSAWRGLLRAQAAQAAALANQLANSAPPDVASRSELVGLLRSAVGQLNLLALEANSRTRDGLRATLATVNVARVRQLVPSRYAGLGAVESAAAWYAGVARFQTMVASINASIPPGSDVSGGGGGFTAPILGWGGSSSSAGAVATGEDLVNAVSADLPGGTVTETPGPAPVPATAAPVAPSTPSWVWVVGGVVALAVVGGAVALATRRK